ncbi:MAG: amidohydrolase [Chloroflexi bacterium]|nr:amidohydrolase [Chloroflexota bacterium]
MSLSELKALACQAIDSRRDGIVGLARAVLANPETGFTEFKTSALVCQMLQELGVPHRKGIALTGIKGYLQGRQGPGPTVAIIGELDSLRVPDHPHANPETGAAHACGHHAQLGMLVGSAVGLLAPGVLDVLSGRVALVAVPAEEFIDVEYRYELHRQGRLGLMSGKQEFIRLGEFDNVDMAMLVHTNSRNGTKLALGGTSTAHLVKYVQFLGRAAHAGGAPWDGINALNAAGIALNAIHAVRETAREKDTIRLHFTITRGGVAVNSVPSDVRLEGRVRGRTLEAVAEANQRVDRCLRAGALAVGGGVRIATIAGYLPQINNSALLEAFRRNSVALVGQESVATRPERLAAGGSTDMGDLSHLMPAIHPYVSGATGRGHGNDYLIEDYDLAVITPAKIMAMTAIDLLSEGAALATEIKNRHKPFMTKEQYLSLQASRTREELYEGR